ncbi:MAG: hypothetical protein AB7F22_30475 [Reyranella sp.]|uniref:hypothetical protein n=1 Tax=Reyranella sp. TaxID=1929291 RepID=UPI003D12596E
MFTTRRIAGLIAVLALPVLAATAGTGVAQPAGDAFDRLPGNEMPGRQIGWAKGGTFEAFKKAVEDNKPMIVVFGSQGSEFSQMLAQKVLPCPHLNQLAGIAVFVYGAPQEDEFARRMALHLKLTEFPTISVIAPRTDTLTELYRMEGLFDAETIARDLRMAFERGGYWPKGFTPAALPKHKLAYPNMICTRDAARR